MKLRRLLKEKLARGHVELTLNLERGGSESSRLNRQIAGGYIQAFRAAAAEFGLAAEPDLNAVLRLPGASTLRRWPPMARLRRPFWPR